MTSPLPCGRPTLFLVDDDPSTGRTLRELAQGQAFGVETFASLWAFLDSCDPSASGCLLVDLAMPGTGGLELFDRLTGGGIHLPVVVLSPEGDVPTVVRVVRAGALNFLVKPSPPARLEEAIEEALKWDAEHRKQATFRARALRRISHLTPGEREVLEMLVEGHSNKTIAEELDLSVRTIEVRRAKLMKKTNARSLAQLIRMRLELPDRFDEGAGPAR